VMFNDLQKYLYHDIIVHWQRDVKVSLKKNMFKGNHRNG